MAVGDQGAESPKVLLASPMSSSLVAALERCYDPVRLVGASGGSIDAAVRALPDYVRQAVSAMVVLGTEQVDEIILGQLPRVRIICCLGSGFDGIDVAAARRAGVTIAHSPGASASSVADLAMGLIIESVREIPRLRRHLHAGKWNGLNGSRPIGRAGLTGRRLGIYGLGAIGRKIADRAVACEMEVGYHGRDHVADVTYPYFPTLQALAQWASVLVLAARADTSNRRIVDASVLRALGPDGHLVNIARGSLVDELALIQALRDGSLAGAGLDVYATEPSPPMDLLTLPNVALTPHIGGVTADARERMEAMVLENLAAHFAGTPVPFQAMPTPTRKSSLPPAG